MSGPSDAALEWIIDTATSEVDEAIACIERGEITLEQALEWVAPIDELMLHHGIAMANGAMPLGRIRDAWMATDRTIH